MNKNKNSNDMKEEIQKILDRNFTRGDNAKALKELLILFDVSKRNYASKIIKDANLDEKTKNLIWNTQLAITCGWK